MLDRLLHFVTGSPAFQFLRSVTPFDFLPDAELKAVTDALSLEYHGSDTTLFVQGQSAVNDLFVVLKGSLELVDESGGSGAAPRLLDVGQT